MSTYLFLLQSYANLQKAVPLLAKYAYKQVHTSIFMLK